LFLTSPQCFRTLSSEAGQPTIDRELLVLARPRLRAAARPAAENFL